MTPRLLLLAALMAGCATAATAAEATVAHVHGRFEATFTAARDYANPLKDVEVTVEFSGPGGARVEVPAFWDGGRTWKVRFSPEAAGAWRYRVTSSDTTDTGVHGREGEFRARPYWGRNTLYRRGAPRLSPNRRYFVQAGGEPWFWLADTAWNGALMATREEWARYLRDRATRRFTAVQFVMTQWRAGRQDELGEVAFTGTDEIRINPEFFQRMDERFTAVNDHGLVALPVLLWALTSKDQESPGAVLPPGQATLLARYMVARYGAHHAIWLLGGDGDYRGAKAERWKTIGREVFPPHRARRPVAMHPGGTHDPWAEFKDEPWLDVLLYQSGHGSDARKWRWNATQGPAVGWQMEPARPVIDAEINYEGHIDYHSKARIGDFAVRRAAYYSLLAGPPAGVTYGAHGIWFWARKPEVPLDHPRSGIADPWHACLDYPGARQMTVLRRVFESMDWWRLRPDRTLLAEDPQNDHFSNHVMAARSDDRLFALLYLPANPSVRLNTEKFPGKLVGVWMDPRTGRRIVTREIKPLPSVELIPPEPGDWVLLLRVLR